MMTTVSRRRGDGLDNVVSWTVACRKLRRIAIEITAAGMEVENVSRPEPEVDVAAVKTNVMITPIISPRIVSSGRLSRRCRGWRSRWL